MGLKVQMGSVQLGVVQFEQIQMGGGWTLHLVLGTILTNQYCFDKIERLCENCAVVIIVPFLVVNL